MCALVASSSGSPDENVKQARVIASALQALLRSPPPGVEGVRPSPGTYRALLRTYAAVDHNLEATMQVPMLLAAGHLPAPRASPDGSSGALAVVEAAMSAACNLKCHKLTWALTAAMCHVLSRPQAAGASCGSPSLGSASLVRIASALEEATYSDGDVPRPLLEVVDLLTQDPPPGGLALPPLVALQAAAGALRLVDVETTLLPAALAVAERAMAERAARGMRGEEPHLQRLFPLE
jgi:hypothetical protein